MSDAKMTLELAREIVDNPLPREGDPFPLEQKLRISRAVGFLMGHSAALESMSEANREKVDSSGGTVNQLREQLAAKDEEIERLKWAVVNEVKAHAITQDQLAAERSENASLGLVGGGLAGALQLAVEILFDNKPGAIGPKMKRLEKEAPAAFAKYTSTREGLTKI